MGTSNYPQAGAESNRANEAVEQLKAIRKELADLRELIDEFAHVALNAAYPFGRATDKWRRP